ncbi:MAG: TIGR00341 family protein [Bacteroidales bacterium]
MKKSIDFFKSKDWKTFLKGYFRIKDDLLPEQEAIQAITDGVSFRGMNIIILVFAMIIASIGLNVNSAAIIIGAMLISPLMGPIIGIGLGIGIYDSELIKRASRNLVMAALFSVLSSTLYFLISPVDENSSELLARTSPSIYDVFIGFFGGGAGIIALSCKQKGNVLPGVAIATALMPPLCTAGYGLATWQLEYLFGALYLFIINSIFIAFATTVGVKVFKFKPHTYIDPAHKSKVQRMVYIIIVLTMLPSIWLTFKMMNESYFVADAKNFIAKEFVFPNTQVFAKDAWVEDGKKHIKVTLIGEQLDRDSLLVAMQNRLVEYDMEGTILDVQQGFSMQKNAINTQELGSVIFKDIYQTNMDKITDLTAQNDSLKRVVRVYNRADSAAITISPEINALFPQVEDIAISRTVFNEVSTNRTDTLNIALVKYKVAMSKSQEERFRAFLRARLGFPKLQLVDSRLVVKFEEPAEQPTDTLTIN